MSIGYQGEGPRGDATGNSGRGLSSKWALQVELLHGREIRAIGQGCKFASDLIPDLIKEMHFGRKSLRGLCRHGCGNRASKHL